MVNYMGDPDAGHLDNFLVKLMFYGWLGAIVVCYVGIAEAMRGAEPWIRRSGPRHLTMQNFPKRCR